MIAIRSYLVRFSLGFTTVKKKNDKFFSPVSGIYIVVPGTIMNRGFMGSSKKEPADSRTIRKSTREESIDTLQVASIDSVNQASNDTIQLVSYNTVHHGSVHSSTVHLGTIHHGTVH